MLDRRTRRPAEPKGPEPLRRDPQPAVHRPRLGPAAGPAAPGAGLGRGRRRRSTPTHTRVAGLRRGVLEVEVDNAVLLQELAHFHKRRLLEQLRGRLPGTTLTDLRFRAGVVRT